MATTSAIADFDRSADQLRAYLDSHQDMLDSGYIQDDPGEEAIHREMEAAVDRFVLGLTPVGR